MKTILMTVLSATAVVTASCQHTQVSRATGFGSYGELVPPRDGQIEVCVTGDVNRAGILWINAASGIDAVEQMVKPDWGEPQKATLTIIRLGSNGRVHEFRYNLRNKTQTQKAALRVQHGDILNFWFGAIPVYGASNGELKHEAGASN